MQKIIQGPKISGRKWQSTWYKWPMGTGKKQLFCLIQCYSVRLIGHYDGN